MVEKKYIENFTDYIMSINGAGIHEYRHEGCKRSKCSEYRKYIVRDSNNIGITFKEFNAAPRKYLTNFKPTKPSIPKISREMENFLHQRRLYHSYTRNSSIDFDYTVEVYLEARGTTSQMKVISFRLKSIGNNVLFSSDNLVEKSFQGLGYGAIMHRMIIDISKQLKYKYIQCFTRKDNTAQCTLLKKNFWKIISEDFVIDDARYFAWLCDTTKVYPL